MFDLFTSLHPHILISLGSYALACASHCHILMFVCTCLYPDILTSSFRQVHMPLLASLHPHNHKFACACLYPCILTSSYSQVHLCLLVYLHPHILISSGSRVLACILASSHPHILSDCNWTRTHNHLVRK